MDDRESGSGGSRKPAPPISMRPTPATEPLEDDAVQLLLAKLRETRPTLLVLAGPIMGARIGLTQRCTVIGRSSDCDVTIPDEGISGRHAQIMLLDDGRFLLGDLGSRNGTLVNGENASEHVLMEGDRIVIGHTPMRFTIYSASEDDLLDNLEQRALQDGLTGIYNRRYLEGRLAQEVRFAGRRGTAVSMLLVDIDHFKEVNDNWGHPVGDRLLVEVAAYVAGCVRTEDVVARYGGDELAVLLRDVGGDGARILAERLQAGLERFPFVHEGNRIPVTVSVGVTTAAGRKDLTVAALVAATDKELYRAKEGGRNRVCCGIL